MDWDAIGAIGEVAGAAGVILSLLYLAVQIRSNTKATRRQNAHNHYAAAREMWGQIASNNDIASMWRRGLIEPENLDPDERVRFMLLMHAGASVAEEDFYARREKDLPAWVSGVLSTGFFEVVRTPGFAFYFAERKHWMSKEFRKKVESEMNTESTTLGTVYTGNE